MEWVKIVGPLILSWPVIGLAVVLMFRRPVLAVLERFTASDQGRAEIGPVKIELGRLAKEGKVAVDSLNRLNLLMAESRLLELEITEANFGPAFSEEQRVRMKQHIAELRGLALGHN